MLETLIGISDETFDRDYRGQKSGVFQSTDDRYSSLFGWDTLNDVLDGSERFIDRISLVKEDARLDTRLYTGPARSGRLKRIIPGAVRQALANGYSVLLDAVHEYDRGVSDFAEYLSNAIGEPASINCYVSWSGDKCFLTHWDDHDVFIVQTEGEKEWSVFRPTRPDPLYADVAYEPKPDELELFWEGVLKPGMVLYIPRGWWHHAKATGQGSIHMTVGFSGRTPLDLLEFVVARACEDNRFRANLVRPNSPAYEQGKQDIGNALVAYLQKAVAGGLVDEFWRHHSARMPTRQINNLPASVDLATFTQRARLVQFAGLAATSALQISPDAVVLELGGKRISFAPVVGPLLERVVAGGVVPVADIVASDTPGMTAGEVNEFLFELVNEGVVNVIDQTRTG